MSYFKIILIAFSATISLQSFASGNNVTIHNHTNSVCFLKSQVDGVDYGPGALAIQPNGYWASYYLYENSSVTLEYNCGGKNISLTSSNKNSLNGTLNYADPGISANNQVNQTYGSYQHYVYWLQWDIYSN
jgi:hypothetical protein